MSGIDPGAAAVTDAAVAAVDAAARIDADASAVADAIVDAEAIVDPLADREAALQALFDAVQAAPWGHDFFALLRRIECLRPEAPRFGRALRPSQEAIRIGQEAELDFAPAALASFGLEGSSSVPRLGVRFFGLLGSQGPMPLHLTEHVRERQRFRNDPTAARFLDIFHHRMLALFYRAWAEAQPTVQHDRPGDDDRFAGWLGATSGLGPESRQHGVLSETARLFQAGLLGSRSRHAEGLTQLLAQYFGVPVRIEQHVAQWMDIGIADRSRLGHARDRPERARSSAAVLGASANPGRRVHDRQYKFRIVLGPLTLAQYQGFLPGGPAWRELAGWVQQYVGAGLLWDVQLGLAQAERPSPRLGQRLTLGITSWLGDRAGTAARAGRRLPPPGAGTAARRDLRLRPGRSFLLRHGVAHA